MIQSDNDDRETEESTVVPSTRTSQFHGWIPIKSGCSVYNTSTLDTVLYVTIGMCVEKKMGSKIFEQDAHFRIMILF